MQELWVSYGQYSWYLLALLPIIVLLRFYSHYQYSELKRLFKVQIIADDIVYVEKGHCSPIERLWFKWTTKNSGHYFDD